MTWKPSEQANMLISIGLLRQRPLALCILQAQEVAAKGMYRLSILSTTVATPCQLQAGYHE